MAAPVRIFLVDDHRIVLDGISSLLGGDDRFAVCGTATGSSEALEVIPRLLPDIVITDIQMPGISGIELTRRLQSQCPAIKVIVLSMSGDAVLIREALSAGASGYLLKNSGKELFCDALLHVLRGETYLSPDVNAELNRTLSAASPASVLTPREIEIVGCIAREMSNAAIASALFISERTVETHRKNIYRKTGTRSVVGLLKYVNEYGIRITDS